MQLNLMHAAAWQMISLSIASGEHARTVTAVSAPRNHSEFGKLYIGLRKIMLLGTKVTQYKEYQLKLYIGDISMHIQQQLHPS